MATQPYLSVVIPAYNEEERLKRYIPGMIEYLLSKDWTFEIIVANDGSKDGTARTTLELAKTYPMMRLIDMQPNRGKGSAVKAGMLDARGKFVLFTDADQSTPLPEVEKLLARLESGNYGMAIGSRAIAGANVEQGQVWYRHLAGRMFGLGTRTLCIHGLADTQCGFKCMTREMAQQIFPKVTSNTAIFDIEMLIVATRAGCRVAEVPVKWIHDPDTRLPYNLRRAIKVWTELFRINKAQRVVWPLRVLT